MTTKSIITQDGIKVDGIPQDWPDDDQRIKDRVAIERRRRKKAGVPDGTVTQVTASTLQGSEILRGLESGLQNVAMQAGNVLGMVSDEDLVEAEQARAMEPQSLGAKVGSFGGEVVGSSAIGGPLVSTARKVFGLVPPIGRAMESVGPMMAGAGRGMGEGAIEGALMAGPGERERGAATGAVLGGAMGAAIPGVVEGPVTPTENARRLLDMGVDLTPGQMNAQGTFNVLEQLAESVPIAGSMTGGARDRAQEEFAQAMVNLARPAGAPEVPLGNIKSMTETLRRSFGPAYAIAQGFPVKPGWDVPLQRSLEYIVRHPAHFGSEAEGRQVKNWVGQELSRYKKRLLVKSEDLLKIRSNVRDKVRELRLRRDPPEAQVSMLESFEDKLTRALEDQLPPEIMPTIREIDRQYAKFKIVQDAAANTRTGTHPSPSAWVRAAQRRADQRQRSESDYFFAPEVEAGQEVFETTLPRTGARAATLATLGIGAGGGYTNPLLTAAVFGPMALASQFPAGRRALAGQTAVQQALQAASGAMPAPVASTLGTVARASPVVYGTGEY